MGLFSRKPKGTYEEYLDTRVEMIEQSDDPEAWETLEKHAKKLRVETRKGNQYYCGICGWVDIDLFPNCH